MRTRSAGPAAARSWAVALCFVAAVLTGLGWVLASPVGSSPDDDYHLGSIWCPGPAGEGCSTTSVDGEARVRVPVRVSPAIVRCYVFQPEVSAACIDDLDKTATDWSPRFDQGNYPGGFYRVHHLLVGPSVEASALAMRTLNVLVAVLLVGGIAAAAPAGSRRALALALAAAWVPMGLYFVRPTTPPPGR